jgi:uncharacterized membrane protein YdbT with pleckstrin-like domain
MNDETSGTTTDASSADQSAQTILYETGPSLRPAIVKLGVALVIGVVITAYLLTHPQLFGTQQNTQIGTYVVVLVVLVLVVRYVVRMYMLKRYQYTITEDGIRWEYSVFRKTRSRELPFNKIRGYEYQQDRVESLFGFGTISLLSGGTNRSLGFVRFENIASPQYIRSIIREQINE